MTVIGFEAANSYVKIKSSKREDAYPNVKRLVGYGEENLIGDDRSQIFRIGSDRYIVGERKFDFTSSSSREDDRYSSADYKIESLIAIAKSVESSSRLTVVTGLPSAHYRDKSVRQKIVDSLSGHHKVYVNDDMRVLMIEKVHVILQPYAALISVMTDEFGNLRLEELTRSTNVVIDVGWGTTDVAIMDGSKLVEYIPIPYSMINAYKTIEEMIRQEFPALTTLRFNAFDLEEQLRDGDTFTKGGKTYQVGEIKQKALEHTANLIMRSIKNDVPLKDFDNVFFAGGGVNAMARYLNSHMESDNAVKIADPQMSIVRGLYNYGVIKG